MLLGKFRHLRTDIYGNREFVEHLRNRSKPLDHEPMYIVINYEYIYVMTFKSYIIAS